MRIITFLLKVLAPKAKAFERATKDPIYYQKKALFEFLRRNKNTEYGKRYNFSKIKAISEYQNTLPLVDCESMRPFIERMTRGEQNIITRDKPLLFSCTSGTSGSHKFIPITKYSQAKKRQTVNLWIYYIYKDHPGVIEGKIFSIVNPALYGYTASGVPYGAESGNGYKTIPHAVKKLHVLPYEVFEISDYDSRYYVMLRLTMEENVTVIATMTPSILILLSSRIESLTDEIINDIEKGTLKKKLDIPENIRRLIEKQLKPNSERAKELREIYKKKGKLLPKDIWSNLKVVACWKRGTVGLYIKEFPKYFGEVPVRDFGYLSTEARCSIPMTDKGAGGVLDITANFYEFILKEDIDKKDKRFFLCNELEKGKEYFVILTTPCGLYRYNIDDIVMIDGFFNKTPVIEFVQRGLNVTSLTGEKLYEAQVASALEKAIEKEGLFVKFFTASMELAKKPHYAFLAEFEENPSFKKKKKFLRTMDEELKHASEEYEFNRNSQELGKPVMKVVASGGFEEYKKRKLQKGTHDAQFKIPELTPDLNFAKEFRFEETIIMD